MSYILCDQIFLSHNKCHITTVSLSHERTPLVNLTFSITTIIIHRELTFSVFTYFNYFKAIIQAYHKIKQ
jgi:hypothetical protein